MEATTEFHKKVSLEQSSFYIEQLRVACYINPKLPWKFFECGKAQGWAASLTSVGRSVGFALNTVDAEDAVQALSLTSAGCYRWDGHCQAALLSVNR